MSTQGTAGASILTERMETFLTALKLGMTRRAAAAKAGFSKSTLYRMLDLDDGTLLDLIEKAEGEAEATFSALVAQAAERPGNWQAAAWWLERRKNDDYGRRDRVDLSIDVRKEAERLAAEKGLDVDAVMAKVDEILGARS